MHPSSASPRASRAVRRLLAVAGLVIAAGSAAAQRPAHRAPSPPGAKASPAVIAALSGPDSVACRPGDTRRICHARRATIQPALPATPRPLARTDDVQGARFIPPRITAFLNDPRIGTYTRAFLRSVAAKPTEDWTLTELQIVMQIVPTLTELHVPTALLSEFYEFLGLDPASLFEPQLGNWQQQSNAFDARNYDSTQQAQCLYLLGYGETLDPSSVKLKDVAACAGEAAP